MQNAMGDPELLRRFQKERSEEAFSALVARYAALVHSAARRQVSSPDLANDVVQSVFLDLAKCASRLRADTHLASWLQVVARRRAVDLIDLFRCSLRLSRHEPRMPMRMAASSCPISGLSCPIFAIRPMGPNGSSSMFATTANQFAFTPDASSCS